jgi:hypothetical protein
MAAGPPSDICALTIRTSIRKINFNCPNPLKDPADLATDARIYSLVGMGELVTHAVPSYRAAGNISARLGGKVIILQAFEFALYDQDDRKRTKQLRDWPAYFHLVVTDEITKVFMEVDCGLINKIFMDFPWQSCDLIWQLTLKQADQKEMMYMINLSGPEVDASPSLVFDSPNGLGMWTGYATLEAVIASDTFDASKGQN